MTLDSRPVALVTGAAGVLGRAICQRLHQDGFDVIAADLNLAAAQDLVGQLPPGGNPLALAVDMADNAAIAALVEAIEQARGRLDVIVNNAAVNHRGALEDFDPLKWDHMMAVNLRGPAVLGQKALALLKRSPRGRVINMVSRCWVAGGPPAYVACKAGLVGLTRSMARELAPWQITVNAVAPGFLPSAFTIDGRDEAAFERMADNAIAQTPLGRLTEPADIAGTVAFLASKDAAFITAEVMHVCGGGQLAPFGSR